MTKYLTIAAFDEAVGDGYDLTDTSTDNIFMLDYGRLPEKDLGNGEYLMTFRCFMVGSSVANMVNQEQELQDYLIQAERYFTDLKEQNGAFIYDSDDGEQQKRATITWGVLEPDRSKIIETRLQRFYTLQIKRKSWQSSQSTSSIISTEMDGVNNATVHPAPKGDINGRINSFTIKATADNNENNPLTEIILGIKPYYDASTEAHDPVFNAEFGELFDTAVVDDEASNCYPEGSSTDNIISWAGASSLTKICTIKIGDQSEATSNLVTNPGAETGNTTGWGDPHTYWEASATGAYVNSGSYGFHVNDNSGAANEDMLQDIDVSSYPYRHFRAKFNAYIANYSGSPTITAFLRYTNDVAGVYVLLQKTFTANQSYTEYVVEGVFPSNPSNFRFVFDVDANGGAFDYAIDDISLQVGTYDIRALLGDHMAYLRCKVSASAEFLANITFGYEGAGTRSPLTEPQIIDNEDYKLIPMGVCSLPPGRYSYYYKNLDYYVQLAWDIYAQEITSGTLYVDAIILVPYKHRVWVKNCEIARDSEYAITSLDSDLIIANLPSDETLILGEGSNFDGSLISNMEYSIGDWNMPTTICTVVIFAQESSVHVISNDFTIDLVYTPRYVKRNTD